MIDCVNNQSAVIIPYFIVNVVQRYLIFASSRPKLFSCCILQVATSCSALPTALLSQWNCVFAMNNIARRQQRVSMTLFISLFSSVFTSGPLPGHFSAHCSLLCSLLFFTSRITSLLTSPLASLLASIFSRPLTFGSSRAKTWRYQPSHTEVAHKREEKEERGWVLSAY
jgi:hypothetical protein